MNTTISFIRYVLLVPLLVSTLINPLRAASAAPAVSGVPVITSATTVMALQNGLFSYQVTATNNPTSYNVTGVIPPGLIFNTTTGLLSGTPTVSAINTLTFSATNASGTGPATTVTLTVVGNTQPNIALTGTATASSVKGTNTAAKAIDGNTSTRWESQYSDPQTFTIDLGQVYTVSSIILDWETAAGEDYLLQVSTDGVTWLAVQNVVGNTTGGVKIYSHLIDGYGRYVRLTGTKRATQYGYSLFEFQVFGSPGEVGITPSITSASTATGTVGQPFSYQIVATNSPTSYAATGLPAGLSLNTSTGLISGVPTTAGATAVTLTATNTTGTSAPFTLTITSSAVAINLALNQPATASSFQPGNPASSANDGNTATRWAAATGAFPQWWQVDLGSSKSLSHVDINWYSNATRSYKYKIETSNDGVTYVLAVDKSNNTLMGPTSDAVTGAARYVKVTIVGASAGFASAYEIGVY